MQLADVLEDWVNREMSTTPAPRTVSQLVDLFGGTRATAQALGVTQRTIQRYVAAEKGTAKETRSASRAPARLQEALKNLQENAAREALAARIRSQGMIVYEMQGEVRVSQDSRNRNIQADVEIVPDEDMWDFADAIEAGNYARAADLFPALFFEAYGLSDAILGDVEMIDMDIVRV